MKLTETIELIDIKTLEKSTITLYSFNWEENMNVNVYKLDDYVISVTDVVALAGLKTTRTIINQYDIHYAVDNRDDGTRHFYDLISIDDAYNFWDIRSVDRYGVCTKMVRAYSYESLRKLCEQAFEVTS